ncbi:MAG: hypothetical protein IKK70_02555 [Clostridia bacterium]|nr:hypothetical protein [Clostridia bacterium]
MKNRVRFIITVVSIIMVSILILTACIHAVAEKNADSKAYDMDIVSETVTEQGTGVIDISPTSQLELQKKFSGMSRISDSGKSITVISEEYLDSFWRELESNGGSEALTSEEVMYIVQDSVRLYFEYDEYVLYANQSLLTAHSGLTERNALFDGTLTGIPISKELKELDDNFVSIFSDIHRIILYRLAALSSSDAFIFADEAIEAVDGLQISGSYPESIFYLPSDSPVKDHSVLTSFICGNVEHGREIHIFDVRYYGDTRIIFYGDGSNANASSVLYPTAEMAATQANRVVYIYDRTEAADAMEEPFWEDDRFIYCFPCIQSETVIALMYDGREIKLTEALEKGYITPAEFDNYDFKYIRRLKPKAPDESGVPYFNATAVFTDKKQDGGIFPSASIIRDTTSLVRYYNEILSSGEYDLSRGTHEIPTFEEMVESYNGPWFESSSLILAVIEADGDVIPKVSSMIVEEGRVQVVLDPDSLGEKKDQVYTIFIDTNKLDVESVEIVCE